MERERKGSMRAPTLFDFRAVAQMKASSPGQQRLRVWGKTDAKSVQKISGLGCVTQALARNLTQVFSCISVHSSAAQIMRSIFRGTIIININMSIMHKISKYPFLGFVNIRF